MVITTKRKGIISAGGAGTRLHPVIATISKQLLPAHDKPMIYYPLSTLMLSGIRDILLILTPQDTPRSEQLLDGGSRWGLNLTYAVQTKPGDLAHAFLIGADFPGSDPCALILGDNVLHCSDLIPKLARAHACEDGATIFAYRVKDPERFGVVELDADNKAISIEEEPARPRSQLAATGQDFYNFQAVEVGCSIKPSARSELEITYVNRVYLGRHALAVKESHGQTPVSTRPCCRRPISSRRLSSGKVLGFCIPRRFLTVSDTSMQGGRHSLPSHCASATMANRCSACYVSHLGLQVVDAAGFKMHGQPIASTRA